MRDTSLEAYKTVDLQKNETMVLGALIELKGRATNQEIADYLKWQINRVTGRTNHLFKRGIIREGEKVRASSGRLAQQWRFDSLQLKLL
jgi:predicted transcriptional regulator